MRKTLTMMARGDTSLKSLRPIAASLAKSSVLFQGMETETVTDTYRWAPPEPLSIPHNAPTVYDPSTKLTVEEKWAARWTTEFMTMMHKQRKTSDELDDDDDDDDSIPSDIPMLGMCFDFSTHTSVYLICDVAARSCDVALLQPVSDSAADACGDSAVDTIWSWPEKPVFEPLVQAISSVYGDVAASKSKGIPLNLATLELVCYDGEKPSSSAHAPFKLSYRIINKVLVHRLKLRRRNTASTATGPATSQGDVRTQPRQSSTDAGDDDDADDDDDDDHDDDRDIELDQELYHQIEDELRGEGDDSILDEFARGLETDQQYQDIESMDDINARLIATVMEKNQEDTLGAEIDIHIGDAGDTDTDVELQRPFEDETGEALFQGFLQSRLSTGAESRNPSGNSTRRDVSRSSHRVELNRMKIDDALRVWKRSISQSFEACGVMNDSLRLLDVDSFDATLSSEVSLVLHDKCSQDSVDVSFVSWVKPHKNLEGRIVNLDDDACIVYPSHFHSTKLTFAGAIIIVPCAGAKVRKQSRERIPSSARRLRQMFSTSVTAFVELDFADADADIGGGQLLCAACRLDDPRRSVNRCCLCTCCWHEQCANQVSEYVNSFKAIHGVPTLAEYNLSVLQLPFTLLSGVSACGVGVCAIAIAVWFQLIIRVLVILVQHNVNA